MRKAVCGRTKNGKNIKWLARTEGLTRRVGLIVILVGHAIRPGASSRPHSSLRAPLRGVLAKASEAFIYVFFPGI
jgi:hypothetical protein